jgi:prophage regulatory protein
MIHLDSNKPGVDMEKLSAITTRVLRLGDVCTKTGLKRSTIYVLMSNGTFPRSFSLVPGGRARGWLEASVDEWLAERRVSSV